MLWEYTKDPEKFIYKIREIDCKLIILQINARPRDAKDMKSRHATPRVMKSNVAILRFLSQHRANIANLSHVNQSTQGSVIKRRRGKRLNDDAEQTDANHRGAKTSKDKLCNGKSCEV